MCVWNTALACGSALWIGAWMQKQERSTSPAPLLTRPSTCPRSEERRVGKSVDLGGRRIIKKKKKKSNDNFMLSSDELGSCFLEMGFHESLFFFSSRRRHTRSLRDWSSDVCSSDLAFNVPGRIAVAQTMKRNAGDADLACGDGDAAGERPASDRAVTGLVGKKPPRVPV